MYILRRFALLATVLATLAGEVALASDVSPMISIGVDANENIEPAVAFSPPHGAFLAVWASEQGANTHDIWARAVNTDGSRLALFVVDSSPGLQFRKPALAYASAHDQYLVVYEDQAWKLWARQISWNGPGSSSPITIDSSPGGYSAAVAYNPQSDKFIVVYQSSVGNITARLVSAETGVVSPPTTLASYSPNDSYARPDVVFDPVNNQYLVVYEHSSPSIENILMRTVAADLSGMSPEFEIANGSIVRQPAISAGPDGVLVSFDWLDVTNMSIYARRAQLDGTPLGAEPFLVLSGIALLDKKNSDVCYDGTGRYFVSWRSFDWDSLNGNIQGRYVSATSDETIGPKFGIDTSPGDQKQPAVACTGEGVALAVLSDRPNPTPNDYDVVGYLVSLSLFTDGFESGDCTEWSNVVGELP
jgi:hypothetical protein